LLVLARPQHKKSALGSSPGEDGFCSSETKHDRRTVPRPKLFVSVRRLREQRLQLGKSVLVTVITYFSILPLERLKKITKTSIRIPPGFLSW
jgi:hypothetical protein